jgi:hypothetical protein
MPSEPKFTDEQFEALLETLGLGGALVGSDGSLNTALWARYTDKQKDILGEMLFAAETPEEREERLKDWPHKRLFP